MKTSYIKRLKVLLVCGMLLSTFLLHQSCTKLDMNRPEVSSAEINSKFFTIPSGTNPVVVRLADNMKAKSTPEYITQIALKNGYPAWNKAMIQIQKKNSLSHRGNNLGEEGDTTVILPFIRPGNLYVDAYLIGQISDTINMYFYDSKNYPDYGFRRPAADTALSAEKMALLTMMLDANTFGDSVFNVVDLRLFSYMQSDSVQATPLSKSIKLKNISSLSQEANLYNTVTTICITFEYEEVYDNPFNVDCPPGGACQWTHTVTATECYTFYGSGGGGGDGGGGGTGPSPGGGVTPGGGSTPGGGGGGGVGWYPTNPPATPAFSLTNPCNVLDSLLRTAEFPNMLNRLRDSSSTPYEIGFTYNFPFDATNYNINYYSGQNNGESDAVVMNLFAAVDGISHNHIATGGRIFSADDIYKLAVNWSKGYIRDTKTFTFTVVTNNTSYILMIENPIQFQAFATAWFDNMNHIEKFSNLFYDAYDMGNTVPAAQQELNFLKIINTWPAGGCGLKVFRGNGNMTSFTPIKLNTSNLATANHIVADPCFDN
jgi:hypothetical protein